MHIAIQAADLDAERIDGTRVYIKQLLDRFGAIAPEEHFTLYHRTAFNPELAPKAFGNYRVRAIAQKFLWTQTRFAGALFRDKPDALWMPVQSLPIVRPKDMKTTVTIHDLAFHFFPDHFPLRDRIKLFALANAAITRSDRIIAVSENTKRDIIRLYPKIAPEKIAVVHHGYDGEMFAAGNGENDEAILKPLGLAGRRYLLYVGAIQPRKNLVRLIRAFEKLKKRDGFEDAMLVLAGERAWLWKEVLAAYEKSSERESIILPGKVPFAHLGALFRNAGIFVYPSLYEGFGLPVLEGFAAGVPVVCARGSSLDEVGGDAAVFFDPKSTDELAQKMEKALSDKTLRSTCIARGKKQLAKFSWDTCARETLSVITNKKLS